ncbi:DUF1565 domain-containing protein [Candidatus Bipolaricaulota bacterium]|nr:DUF1565 domain-containing protein [Candidatus Bipolaricaulota bacterium]
MRYRALLVAVFLVLSAAICGLSTEEELTNDSGKTAVAVRITFSTRVMITSHGREFSVQEPASGLSDVFVFSDGEVRRNGTFEVKWSPGLAIKSVEWLTQTSVQAEESTCEIQVSPKSGVAPLSIDYVAVISNCSDSINEYLWDIADEGFTGGSSGTHIFSYPGAYLIHAQATACGVVIEDTQIVTVDPVYVDGSTGSDLTADGSYDSPFATISAALRSTNDERPIVVAEGIYSIASGEDEMIQLGGRRSIVGTGSMVRPHIAVPISCGDGSVIAQVQCSTVYVSRVQGVLLWDVLMFGFDGAIDHGVYVNSGGGVSVMDSRISGFGTSIYVVHEGAYGEITRCTVSGEYFGIWYGGRATGSVSSCVINESIRGVVIAENARVSIEGSRIEGNDNGVFVRDASVVDLGGGSLNSGGNNSFANNRDYNIRDERTPYSGAISAIGNEWYSHSSATAVITGPATNYNQEKCYIENPGNSIVISD